MAWKGGEVAKDNWNVCWDFENPKAKQSTWTGKGYWKQAEQESYPWPQNQNQWWDQAPSWPAIGHEQASWAYMQQQLVLQALGAGTSYDTSVFAPREETQDDRPLITAMPASLEKRIAQLEDSRTAPPAPDREFEGSVKSVSERNSYGFISCEDVHALYHRDTYCPKELMPEGTKVADQVIFKIGLSKKGHPQVIEIRKAS